MVAHASAQIAFKDVSVAAGFSDSASETWGAAWGDIDNDLYPDIFVNNHRTRAKLYRNNRDGTFSDVSLAVDASRTGGWTGGRENVDKHGDAWGDIDNDGDDDLIITVSQSSDRLLINDNGVLTDRTALYGVDRLNHTETRQNLFLDYNGDGRLDLASIGLVRPAFSPQLPDATFGFGAGYEQPLACASDGQWAHLSNVGAGGRLAFLCAPRNGSYPKVNDFANSAISDISADFPQSDPVNDAAILDYNRDLRPDVFVIRRAERPSGAYQFADNRFEAQLVTAANNGKSVTFKSTGVLTLTASLLGGDDPQGDPRYIDIGSIKWHPTSLTVELDPNDTRNAGIGTGSLGINVGYSSATGEWTITQGTSSYDYSYVQVSSTAPISEVAFHGASVSDSGYPGLLQENTASGFVDVSTGSGFTAVLPCQSAVAGDFDNDMDEDIFLTCTGAAQNLPDRLFMNDGTGRFTEVSNGGGAAGKVGAAVADHAGTGDSVVAADYDRDGFLDLFVTNGLNMRPVYIGGPKQIFHNVGNANHWIELDLVGTTSNRDGTGAKVLVSAGGITQYREQNGGYHRWSQNFRRVHVGLGPNTVADVTVQWPDGTSTSYPALAANHLFEVKQDGTLVDHEAGIQWKSAVPKVSESTKSVTLTVSRSGPSAAAASVDYATASGTATSGSDFAAASGTLTWAAHDATDRTITIAIIDDTTDEADTEDFTVTLSNPVGTSVGSGAPTTIQIADNDAPPTNGGGTGGDPPGTDPPGTDPPGTDPPGTDPPGTDPPGTDPPGTDPPGNEPPTDTASGGGGVIGWADLSLLLLVVSVHYDRRRRSNGSSRRPHQPVGQ